MESVLKTNDGRPLCVGARDLDGVLDGLGAGVQKDGFLRKIAGSQRVQFFRQGNVAFVGSDGEAEMQVLLELFPDRGEHPRRAVADIEAADTSGEIEIAITIDILDGGAVSSRGEDRRGIRRATWNSSFAARHQGARLGPRYFGANLNRRHFCFPDILRGPRDPARGRSRTVCSRPRAPRRTSAACD